MNKIWVEEGLVKIVLHRKEFLPCLHEQHALVGVPQPCKFLGMWGKDGRMWHKEWRMRNLRGDSGVA